MPRAANATGGGRPRQHTSLSGLRSTPHPPPAAPAWTPAPSARPCAARRHTFPETGPWSSPDRPAARGAAAALACRGGAGCMLRRLAAPGAALPSWAWACGVHARRLGSIGSFPASWGGGSAGMPAQGHLHDEVAPVIEHLQARLSNAVQPCEVVHPAAAPGCACKAIRAPGGGGEAGGGAGATRGARVAFAFTACKYPVHWHGLKSAHATRGRAVLRSHLDQRPAQVA